MMDKSFSKSHFPFLKTIIFLYLLNFIVISKFFVSISSFKFSHYIKLILLTFSCYSPSCSFNLPFCWIFIMFFLCLISVSPSGTRYNISKNLWGLRSAPLETRSFLIHMMVSKTRSGKSTSLGYFIYGEYETKQMIRLYVSTFLWKFSSNLRADKEE